MRLFCPYCHNPLSNADVNQLQAEVAALRVLVHDLIEGPLLYAVYNGDGGMTVSEGIEWAEADMRRRARELGVEDGRQA